MYVSRHREVSGWEFNLPEADFNPIVSLPLYAPIIKDGGGRSGTCNYPIVAIRMDKLSSRRNGRPKFCSRDELSNYFRIAPSTKIVITSVGFDEPLERLWRNPRRAELLESIAALDPVLMSSPNFSLFSNVPRHENLYNMKRIAIVWREMVQAGIPTALHINARTDRDWKRWREFVIQHPEINAIAFEFLTGARQRLEWYAEHLKRLASSTERGLTLVLRGGQNLPRTCLDAFDQVMILSANAFVKTMKRRWLLNVGERLRERKWRPVEGTKLDVLLAGNIQAERNYFEKKIRKKPTLLPAKVG